MSVPRPESSFADFCWKAANALRSAANEPRHFGRAAVQALTSLFDSPADASVAASGGWVR
jgi:hypothetical protein